LPTFFRGRGRFLGMDQDAVEVERFSRDREQRRQL
jgi:hypothetical protein